MICLGNSFAHLFDMKGDMSDIKLAIKNFHEMIKPNGYLLIDHRNYDYTLKHGKTPAHSIYYNVSPTSLLLFKDFNCYPKIFVVINCEH